MKYVIQQGQDVAPKYTNNLPKDIPSLQLGQFLYSNQANGWVSHNLSKEDDLEIYNEKIKKV